MLNGVTPQHIRSNGQGIYGLEVNHSSQVNLNDDATILHQLTLTQGKIKTGNQAVSIPAGATVYRTLGWVDGRMQKHVSDGSQVTLTFEIGDSLFYTPVQFTFDSVTTPVTCAFQPELRHLLHQIMPQIRSIQVTTLTDTGSPIL
ncbi:MAG: hypothetical protein HWD58_10785 [Bacteroidota bacterium]|nr:MAG: hypothetical protein HWD58_10785 [Bacteroidota bacterium]